MRNFQTRQLALWSGSLAALLILAACAVPAGGSEYEDLLTLFEEWRLFERPDLKDGAPDYTAAAMAEKARQLPALVERLESLDTSGWTVDQKVDAAIVRAEMNGLDFNLRVLEPWARDPAFYTSVWTYQSDTPAHEGPTHHALVELWTYDFPLSAEAATRLTGELATIPPLLMQARDNLTGNAKELWEAGIGDLRGQRRAIESLGWRVSGPPELQAAIEAAEEATVRFIDWLEVEAPKKTGPSGIGKENYTWYLQNVHLVPMTWEDEVR
ncbi:MAG: DUF885 family protein, partial [Acidobacteriota bacterium]